METIDRNIITAQETLKNLRSSIRRKGDLPGLSNAVRLVEMTEVSQEALSDNMVQAVLADPALVQKVLRLANSSMYATFGGTVSTVSRAVALLGTDTIAHLAVSQKLIDNLAAVSSTSEDTRKTMETAVLAGHLARQIAIGAKIKGVEAVAICALLHSLGKLLLAFYLPQEYQQLKVRLGKTQLSENQEAMELLGISLDELGLETAREWGFPTSILDGLRFIPPEETGTEPPAETNWLASISSLAHQCAEAISKPGIGPSSEPRLVALIEGYAGMLGVPADRLRSAVSEGEAHALAERSPAASENSEPAAPRLIHGIPANLPTVLSNCVQEISGDLSSSSPGRVLSLATEAVFAGLGLHRAFVFVRKNARYSAGIGLGPGAAELLHVLSFEEGARVDAVYMAMLGNRIVYLDDVRDPGQQQKVPLWWKARLSQAKSFIILPLVVQKQPLGFIYGEWLRGYPDVVLDSAARAQLDNLRSTVVSRIVRQNRPEQSA
jgi:HD-like signal output (HDOD) protein